MFKTISPLHGVNQPPKPFKAGTLDQIIILRGIARFCGVELSLVETKELVEATEASIRTAHDFVAMVEAVITSRK